MFRVIACLDQNHDHKLVLLAAVVCMIGCYTTVRLLARATSGTGMARLTWVGMTSVAFGCGVWSTHFIAMLAYEPQLHASFLITPTLLSLVVAIAGSVAAFSLFVARHGAAVVAGTVLGGSIGAMHFLGMTALIVPGLIIYDPGLVVWSLAIGVVLGIAGLLAVPKLPQPVVAGILVLAICGMHFTAMGAVTILRFVLPTSLSAHISPTLLAVAVAAVSLLILLLSLVGSIVDQHLASRTVREAARLRQFADSSFEGIVFHRDGLIIDANAEISRMCGVAPEQLLGSPVLNLFAPAYRAAIAAPARDTKLEVELLDSAGKEHPAELLRRSIEQNGKATEVLVLRDVSDRKRAEERIAWLAHYDSLTGLANRPLFHDRLAQELARIGRAGSGVALLCIDLDRFKAVNDLYGHPVGDKVLIEVANRLTTATREADTVARLGGDEFAIVQPAATHMEAAILAGRVVAILNKPYDIDGTRTSIGASVGVGLYPGDGNTPETLLKHADLALYRAKQDGRGVFRFFETEMDLKLRERHQLEEDLRNAIGTAALQLHYQPQFDCESRRLTGYEALLRWQHPVHGAISPADFIPLAEERGLIVPLGSWVLETACTEAASWNAPYRIAVNLSPAQFKHFDLVAEVEGVLERTGLDPHRLELEVTEGLLIDDTDCALATLQALKALGIRIALDDFGTGYSSLSYLRRFPFDKIKIDRSFVQGMGDDANPDAIVRTILALGRSLGLSVTAEGVETEAQYAHLREQHCNEVQGFLLGRPVARTALHHEQLAVA